jgi:heme/copper-type cytochrome/quinol oxidase subunit 3
VSEANLSMGHGAGVMEASPFAIPSKKLVMWLFIISDACTFGAMLYAYGYLKNAAADWPHPFESASIMNALLMTFILVTSSLTILIGVRAAKAGNKSKAMLWTFITIVLGLAFAALHLKEWTHQRGCSPLSEPMGLAYVWSVLLRYHWSASGSRRERSSCPAGRDSRLQAWPL